MTANRYRLMGDVKSIFYDRKGAKVYGKKGDIVKEISASNTVLIVEDKHGDRFPASINELQKL